MTPVELRQFVSRLNKDEYELVQALVAAPAKRPRCVYCGAPSRGLVCHAHSDLLVIDPAYMGRAA